MRSFREGPCQISFFSSKQEWKVLRARGALEACEWVVECEEEAMLRATRVGEAESAEETSGESLEGVVDGEEPQLSQVHDSSSSSTPMSDEGKSSSSVRGAGGGVEGEKPGRP